MMQVKVVDGWQQRNRDLEDEIALLHERLQKIEAALLTIAEQAWPEGMKPYQFAQLVLWGALCYWCRGFDHVRHPGSWHGCVCKEDEPWD